MVGPPSRADRERRRRWLALGVIGIVALSSGLTGLYGGADPLEVGLLLLAGAVVGVALVVAIGLRP